MNRILAMLGVAMMATSLWAAPDEPWTESTEHWSLVNHPGGPEGQVAENLRLDETFNRFGAASVAFDFKELDKRGYAELRLNFPQPFDARSYDVLHLSYHVPAGVKVTALRVNFITKDWDGQARLPELLEAVTGEWQDLTIPLAACSDTKGGWDWSSVSYVLVNFWCHQGAGEGGTVHLDGLWLERTGEGIGEQQAPPAILFLDQHPPNEDIDETHRDNLEAAGFAAEWELLEEVTWDQLRQFNVVVMLLAYGPEADAANPGQWSGGAAGKRELLERFVAEGGGLLITGTPNSKSVATGINYLLEPMGATIVNEQVSDPLGMIFRQKLYPRYQYAYTEAITPGPLTEGVLGLWYCTSLQFTGGGGGGFAVSLDSGPNWQVLVKGSPTARTQPFHGAFDVAQEIGSFSSSPPLCGVRELDKGRVAMLTMQPTHLWLSGYHDWWDGLVMSKGAQGKASGAERLLLNLYAWLAQPSQQSGALGGYRGKVAEPIEGARYVERADEGGVIDWQNREVPGPSGYQYVGLIGAHSAFSDGEGIVAEWVEAAQAAGYDWIAFTENYEQMTEGKWKQLMEQCEQFTNDSFCAIPGLELVDRAGNHSLVLAPMPWPEPELQTERLELATAIGYTYRFPAQVQYRFEEGLRRWYRQQFHFAGVYTYREGKLVDDGLDEYYQLCARTFKVWPMAIHETFRPGDVARERQTGYQTWYTYGPLDKMYEDFCYYGWKFAFNPGMIYLSDGPRIERFAIQNSGTSYFDIPPESEHAWRETKGGDRWRIVARASSPVGIKTLRILDSGSPLRVFSAGGQTEFSQIVDGHHDRQYCFALEITDQQGRRALACCTQTTAGRHWFNNCSDNNNLMEGGAYGTTVRPPKGFECYFPRWGWSHDRLWPDLAIVDKQRLNPPHDEVPRFVSADCAIVDHLVRVTHDPEELPVGGGRLARPLYPIEDFEARQRSIFFTPGVDTSQFILLEPQVTLKRDVTVERGRFPNLRLLFVTHNQRMSEEDFVYTVVTTEEGQTLVEEIPMTNKGTEASHWGTLPVGGYAGTFPNFTGVGALFALEPDTQFAMEGNPCVRCIYIGKQVEDGTVLPAGTVLSTRALFMTGKWRQLGGNQEIEHARKMLGLLGTPGYTVTSSIGSVVDTQYTCTLRTENGAFRAKFSQTPLPTDLPIVIPNLQDRWDSGLWVVGTGRVRHFGRFEATGYTTLRLDKGSVEAFLGHPLVCDSPELWLSLVEADSQHLLVVLHNPTDEEIQTRLRKSQGFDLGPPLDQTVTVPAASSVTVQVP